MASLARGRHRLQRAILADEKTPAVHPSTGHPPHEVSPEPHPLERYGDGFEDWLDSSSENSTDLSRKISCPSGDADRSYAKKKFLHRHCHGISLDHSKCDRFYTDDDIFLLLQFSGTDPR